jgi:hypothetical protein
MVRMSLAHPRPMALVAPLLFACASSPPSHDPDVPAPLASASTAASAAVLAPSSHPSLLPPTPTSAPTTSAAPATSQAAASPTVKTYFVDSKRIPCEGEGIHECLRVRESEAESWYLFYRTLEGFEFEPGHTYELRVSVEPVADRPADAASKRYRVLEVVSKRRVP